MLMYLAPLLGIPSSFMVSGAIPGLYAIGQAIIEYLPVVPGMTAELEFPFAVVDGFTRAYLLCNLIPPAVTTHSSLAIASSPWTLLVSSLVCDGHYLQSPLLTDSATGYSKWRILPNKSVLRFNSNRAGGADSA